MKTLFLLFISFAALAGQGKGGGDVVVCYDKDDNIIRMEAYDFWNASKKFNLTIKENAAKSYMDKVKKNLKRLSQIDPIMADILLKNAEIFSPENLMKPNETIGFVPGIINTGDGVQTIVPSDSDNDCHNQTIERIAEFTVNSLPFEKKFKLRSNLWRHINIDETTKYAIVQHEAIYKLFREKLGQKDSEKAQLYNAYISSEQFESVTPYKYFKFISNLRIGKGEGLASLKIGSKLFNLSYTYFYSDGKLKGGDLFEEYSVKLQGQDILVNELYYYPSGNLRKINTVNEIS